MDPNRNARDDRGIALVLSLFLMMAMSVVGASLMFLSQTETYSSMNYRLMSQARYGAESGIQTTVNYLINSYTPPSSTADLLKYDTTKSPVLCLSGCTTLNAPVVLSANSAQASNYPDATVQAAFSAAAQGSLPSGTTTVTYTPYATLLSMQQIKVYGGGYQTIQTWQITSDGTISAGKTATVEVTATLEREKIPAAMYAAFGTNPGCGSLTFTGSSNTDSYDSSAYSGTGGITPTNGGLTSTNGNVGTNGNLGESGSATVNGSLSSPRVGVGSCSSGNVDALSQSGHATVTGGVVQLPQAVTMPTPAAPSPLPPTTNITINSSASCAALSLTAPATCSGSGGNLTVDAHGSIVSLGNVSLSGGANVSLVGGPTGAPATYNVNSISFAGNSTLTIASGSIVLNVAGKDSSGNWLATPIDFTGGSFSNASMDPSKFQIDYAGTGQVVMTGGNSAAALVYAPNAASELKGSAAFYGALVTSTLLVSGGANIHYDRKLSTTFFTAGNAMMSTFSWKKY
jgi:Tfp pilus assembly protein PilX